MTLLIVIAVVLAVIVLMLSAPVDIEIAASVRGHAVCRTRVKLFSGLISFDVGGGKGKGKEDRGKTGSGAGTLLEKVSNAAQVDGIWQRSRSLLRKLSSCVSVKRLAVNLTVSLGDDYYTGMLAGLAIPLVLYLDRQFDGGISLRPVFEEELMFEGDLFAGLRLQPLKMIVPCLVFVCSPQLRRVKGIFFGG